MYKWNFCNIILTQLWPEKFVKIYIILFNSPNTTVSSKLWLAKSPVQTEVLLYATFVLTNASVKVIVLL